MEILSERLRELSQKGFRPAAAARLAASLDTIARSLTAAIRDQIPAFTASGNPDVLPQLDAHALDHLTEIHRLIGGSNQPQLEFVRRHAARRAEQHFPLEATLEAYRCSQRLIAAWLRNAAAGSDATSAIDEFVRDYVNTVSSIATAEYVKRTRQLSEADADRRSQLLTLLLAGYDESDSRIARLLRGAGYLEQRQAYCVVLARPVNLQEMDRPARANRLLAAVRDAFSTLNLRALYGLHNNHVVAIVSITRRLSGWTKPEAALAKRIAWPLLTLGNSVLAGVSADAPSTALIPKALREAELALDTASARERVVSYADIPLRKLLLNLAEDKVQSALPHWTRDLTRADKKSRGKLSATLQSYGDADMNVLKAAKSLKVHPNTIYARMQKIRDITGQDPTRFNALNELLLALDCVREQP
ncbi:MAG: helix-turn-helix domain-containing protein [Pseudomonadota bacterium]